MKYYSFYVGGPKADIRKLLFIDIKIPSVDLYRSIILFYFLDTLRMEKGVNKIEDINFFIPARSYVEHKIQKIVEYEIVPTKNGSLLVRYRKVRIYHKMEFLKYFKK